MEPEDLAKQANICDVLSEEEVRDIGRLCLDGLKEDLQSRTQWEASYAEAIKLALQVKGDKAFPWAGCSNIKFPLLTVAALNWHAKAYPAVISGDLVVKMRVYSSDPDGEKSKKAERVSRHMSFQLLETTTWEEQTDKSLLILSILGCVFKKTVRDTARRKNCSDMVMPQDLVVNYYTTDMASCPRATHLFTLSPNEIRENVMGDIYSDGEALVSQPEPNPLSAARDQAQRTSPPPTSSVVFMAEQSCFLDLDNDGYAEPYAVTFERETGKVRRIHARYYSMDVERVKGGPNDGKVKLIRAENYYTKYSFIPSPDGGFYDLGFGVLLGPVNESVNTALNQIFDAGTMATLGGGFLGRGVRMRGGEASFKPFEWKTVDSTGISLKDNIVPLQVREPSMMLLELIKFLVGYGERIAGASEIEMGQLPDNAKSGAVDVVNENGQKIFNATYKRVWRAMKEEFKKLYRLNRIFSAGEGYLDGETYQEITADDYSLEEDGICPAADPNIVSENERQRQALLVASRAEISPGYNRYLAEKSLLQAFRVPNSENLLPDPAGPNAIPQGPDLNALKLEIDERNVAVKEAKVQLDAQAEEIRLLTEAKESDAKIQKLQAEAILILKEADSTEVEQAIAIINAQIGAEKVKTDQIKNAIALLKERNDQRRVGVVDAARGDD